MISFEEYLRFLLAGCLIAVPVTFYVLIRTKFVDIYDVLIVYVVVIILVAAFVGGLVIGANVILAL